MNKKRISVTLFFLCFGVLLSVWGQEEEVKISSLIHEGEAIPKEVIKATREFRERLMADPYRPAYHFTVPDDVGAPGDPNGAFYHNGKYHLMYLYNRTGSGFSWGHVSSTDMVHWKHHPDALVPGDGDEGVFSGGAFVDEDGSAYLSYWMLWGAKGIGIAKNLDDQYNLWKKIESNPVIKSTEWGITELTDKSGKNIHVSSADPSNIWKKDGMYYMLTGNLLVLRKYGSRGKGLPANRDEPPLPKDSLDYQGDRLSLFASKNLKDWTYQHEFYQSERKWTSKTEDNMCPSFLPLPSGPDGGKASDKHLLLFISHNKGCQYYVGDYKKDKFYPEVHGRMSWEDNAYFAPEALIDGKGRQIMWSWIFDDRPASVKEHYGWTGTYGLPRSLWLGDDGSLHMQPVEELQMLRVKEDANLSNIGVAKGVDYVLDEYGNELMELELTIDPNSKGSYGVKVCVSKDGSEETKIYYDPKDRKLKFDTTKSGKAFGRKIIEEAPLELKEGEPLVLRVYVDRSIVEVFANDRQAIARSIYPSQGSQGIRLFSDEQDMTVRNLKIWELNQTNPY